MKKHIVFKIIFLLNTISISGNPLPLMNEFQVPIPDIQYELPEALIGDFIMVSPAFYDEISIFPNNKFIAVTFVPAHRTYTSYGHIVNIDDKWYLNPIFSEGYLHRRTEIFLTDSGFSYYDNNKRFLTSLRKENIPVPNNLAAEINVPRKITKRHYFLINSIASIKIECKEIEVDLFSEYWSYRLEILNGIVKILLILKSGERGPVLFEGFIDKTEDNTDIFKGIIKFTNGVSYYYIKNGIAEIEINREGNITITMFYTPASFILNQLELPDGFIFPAKMVLEF